MKAEADEPGTTDAAVRVPKSLDRIAKSGPGTGVVRTLPGNGQRDGILVEPASAGDPDVRGVVIRGFRIEGLPMNGIRLRHVNDLTIEDNGNGLEPPAAPSAALAADLVAIGAADSRASNDAVQTTVAAPALPPCRGGLSRRMRTPRGSRRRACD